MKGYFQVLLVIAVVQLSTCGPILYRIQPPKGQAGQVQPVDSAEIHEPHAEKGQELVDDSLPDRDNDVDDKGEVKNDGAGDGKHEELPVKEDTVLKVVKEEHEPPAMPLDKHAETLEGDDKISMKDSKGEETVIRLKQIPEKQLVPQDHLDLVKMERDGHINKDYHKEMFLGELHDEFKAEAVDDAASKLQEVVASADLDKDGLLSAVEMEEWIRSKMMEHLDAAKRENEVVFGHLDPDGDGLIKWKEFYVHFLHSLGFGAQTALKHVLDYDDSIKLEQKDKDALISYKFKWTDADTNITDNKLTKEEFLVFRHPEHSKRSLETLVSNVMRGVDANNDKVITEEEFASLPPGEVESKEFEEMDRRWQEERRKEFRDIMDQNRDGKVDLTELKDYLDPTNPVQAKVEADSLMNLMDDNRDALLSMEEILKHSDIFISSKLVNFAANMHDEF